MATTASTNEIRILNLPLAMILSCVMLVYFFLVMLAVCIISKVCRHVTAEYCCMQCTDLGMTCMQCCTCTCKCAQCYSCMQQAADECWLVSWDCLYTFTHCMYSYLICNITTTAPPLTHPPSVLLPLLLPPAAVDMQASSCLIVEQHTTISLHL